MSSGKLWTSSSLSTAEYGTSLNGASVSLSNPASSNIVLPAALVLAAPKLVPEPEQESPPGDVVLELPLGNVVPLAPCLSGIPELEPPPDGVELELPPGNVALLPPCLAGYPESSESDSM